MSMSNIQKEEIEAFAVNFFGMSLEEISRLRAEETAERDTTIEEKEEKIQKLVVKI